MNRLCCQKISCPDQPQTANLEFDFPLANFSSEAPDPELFFGFDFGNLTPPIDVNWTDQNNPGFCTSLISQDDANLCAIRNQQTNTINPGGRNGPWTNPNGTPVGLVGCDLIQCSWTCPDGNLFTWTIAPGAVVAANKQLANSIASSIACNQARLRHICLTDIPATAMVGQPYTALIGAAGGTAPITFSLASGALPPGLSIAVVDTRTISISGTPTSGGPFTFVILASDGLGNFMQKTFTITVQGLDWTKIVWDSPIDFLVSNNTPPDFGSFEQDIPKPGSVHFSGSQHWDFPTVPPVSCGIVNNGILAYNGPTTTTKLTITVNSFGIVGNATAIQLLVGDNDTSAIFLTVNITGAGVSHFNFTVPSTTRHIFVQYAFNSAFSLGQVPFTDSADIRIDLGV